MNIALQGADVISDQSAVRIALKVFEQSGVLTDAIKDWRKTPVAERTWVNIQAFFIAANKEGMRVVTANDLGFASANAAREAAQALAATATPTTGQRNAGGGGQPPNNTNNANNNATGMQYNATQ
jgi:hypothetical protein